VGFRCLAEEGRVRTKPLTVTNCFHAVFSGLPLSRDERILVTKELVLRRLPPMVRQYGSGFGLGLKASGFRIRVCTTCLVVVIGNDMGKRGVTTESPIELVDHFTYGFFCDSAGPAPAPKMLRSGHPFDRSQNFVVRSIHRDRSR
jgi:hypothetical protein